MKFSEIKSCIKNQLEPFLKEFDFYVVKGNASSGFSIEYANEAIKLKVGTDKLTRSDGYELPFGIEQIQFSAVEKLIHPLVVKHELYDTASAPSEFDMTFGSNRSTGIVTDLDKKIQAIHIDSENDIVNYCQTVKELLLQYSFPWFQKYSKLEAVNEFINSMDDFESGQSFAPPHMLRKLVIKKLCNDASYGNYLSFWKERFENAKDLENGKYLPYLNAVLDLEEILKN